MVRPPMTPLQRNTHALLMSSIGYAVLVWGLFTQPLDAYGLMLVVLLALLGPLLNSISISLPGGTHVGLEATAYYAAMLILGPWAAGLVAMASTTRWWFSMRAMPLASLFRNTGMYTIMAVSGGLFYRALGGEIPLTTINVTNLLALALTILLVRAINVTLLLSYRILFSGVAGALQETRATILPGSLAEMGAYLPALLTALLHYTSGLAGLLLWLLVFLGGAFAVYQVALARRESAEQLAQLSDTGSRLAERGRRETSLAEQLGRAADDLAGYSSRLAGELLNQHTAITQVGATIEELAQQAHYIADTAGTVAGTAADALATVGRGQDAAQAGVQAMADLERNVTAIHEQMQILEAKSRLISRALSTINNIANETHLLALNATIEAAGAGEQGRRFAVVATQINALADQALRAATDIGVTVREISAAGAATREAITNGLQETRRYTGQVDEASQSLDMILAAVEKMSKMAQGISLATEQQTQAVRQTGEAIRELAEAMGAVSGEGRAVSTAAEGLRRTAAAVRRAQTLAG